MSDTSMYLIPRLAATLIKTPELSPVSAVSICEVFRRVIVEDDATLSRNVSHALHMRISTGREWACGGNRGRPQTTRSSLRVPKPLS